MASDILTLPVGASLFKKLFAWWDWNLRQLSNQADPLIDCYIRKKSIRFNVESGRSWVLTVSATTSSLLHVDSQKRLYCRSTDGDAEPKDYTSTTSLLLLLLLLHAASTGSSSCARIKRVTRGSVSNLWFSPCEIYYKLGCKEQLKQRLIVPFAETWLTNDV
jgi:hypothetical protein